MRGFRVMVHTVAISIVISLFSVGPLCKLIGQDSISLEYMIGVIENRKQKYVGKQAPQVATTTIDGKVWHLGDQKGKIIVLDFWATWCKGCVQAMPEIDRLYKAYENSEEIEFVGVALDTSGVKVIEYCERNNIRWVQLFEPGKGFKNSCAMALGLIGIPEICIIDKRGIVVGVFIQSCEVDDYIKKLLQ